MINTIKIWHPHTIHNATATKNKRNVAIVYKKAKSPKWTATGRPIFKIWINFHPRLDRD